MPGDDWNEARRYYMRDVRSTESSSVIDQRRRSLNDFEEWVDGKQSDRPWNDLRVIDGRSFIQHLLDERGLDEWTVAGRYTSLKHMYSWVRENVPDTAPSNVWANIDMSDYRSRRADEPRIEAETGDGVRRFSPDQVDSILENVPRPETRNKLVIRLMLNTGLRPGEIKPIRLQDVDLDARSIHISSFKSSPPRTVWYPRNMSRLFGRWVQDRRAAFQSAHTSDRVFVTRKKPRMSGNAVCYMVRRALHNAGIITAQEFADDDEKPTEVWTDQQGNRRYRYSAHVCRHTFAMDFLEDTVADAGSVYALKELLGHKDVSTTVERYLRDVKDETVKEAARRYGPDY